jgi:hypothetical protein
MTALEYGIAIAMLSVPLGFILGIIMSFSITEDFMERLVVYILTQVGVPLFSFLWVFLFMGWFSIFITDLKLY